MDTFLEHLTVASRAAETLVAALEDTQIVTADFGTSLLKVQLADGLLMPDARLPDPLSWCKHIMMTLYAGIICWRTSACGKRDG